MCVVQHGLQIVKEHSLQLNRNFKTIQRDLSVYAAKVDDNEDAVWQPVLGVQSPFARVC